MEQERIRVILFDDNQSFRIGLSHLIRRAPDMVCVGAFADCSNLVKDVSSASPDVILMDIQMPGISGIEAVRILREKYPGCKILMQTIFEEDEKVFRSILAGASGYILKSTPVARILDAIREIHEGGAPISPSIAAKVMKMVIDPPTYADNKAFNLSDREKEILACLVKGMSYKLIADACLISIDTVRGHIRNIYDKLHVHSKGEAITKAIKGKII